ncbi:suppressor of fused domain protein [Rhodococcoides fascians]|uniref:suppressor of fused domain protein n=1 Tax=Rhodococcoides fascians TaxID=1828 RepID=UPI00055A967E|nr:MULTISPECIES: suppressor of fused domain protein [Rhodococcus]OZE98039.1 Suppressor of fused protein (SUFU) [Rhodococcus sp. 15-1189-1-1a]OZF12689.1 Suppressor of fused protein (SUFU) [Rhodococcus sp. 14-2686-1-2]
MDFVSDSVIARVRSHLLAAIGDEKPTPFSVTFLGLESLDVLTFFPRRDEFARFVTLGCSRYPMSDPSEMIADSTRGPRAELVLVTRVFDGIDKDFLRNLAKLAATPSVEGVVLREDLLLDLGEPLWAGAPFTAVLLGRSDIDDLELPEPADPVQFFDVVPITGTEAAWVRLRGAEALREAWTEAGIDIRDPSRSAVTL